MSEPASPLLERVVSGEDPSLVEMAARGLLPLSPHDLIPLQVSLTNHADPQVASLARQALDETEPRILAGYLSEDAGAEVLTYFASAARHPTVVEALLRRRDVPRRLLMVMAEKVKEEQQEVLLLRQDAIVEEPAILDALERNPQVSRYSVRRIGEYREHLLPRKRAAPAEGEVPEEEPEVSEEELRVALEQARTEEPGGERDQQTGLSEAQIRTLPVPVRLRLARGASRTLRSILLRDPNPRVAVAVIQANPVSDQEVEVICHNRSVCEEVLEEISRRREWARKPTIVYALVQNPRTPVAVALRFVPRLSVRELRELSRNRNIPDAVRSAASRLYKIKQR